MWVTCWPARDAYLSNPEFAEVASRYLGLASPTCEQQAGEVIAGSRHTLDRHGLKLSSLQLPGDGWRTQHDAILNCITRDAKEMGVAVRSNVYGLFSACIPQDGRQRFDGQTIRKRQGLVPDFMMTLQWDGRGPERRLLLELKTLHYGTSTYAAVATARCQAVERRASGLPALYTSKAQRVDKEFCGTDRRAVGPVEQRLRCYEPVKGLVFGAWTEASPDTHKLLSALAAAGAERHWKKMGARSSDDARGALAWLLRRRWAMTAAREAARLTLARLELVGPGAVAARERRMQASSSAADARRESCWQQRGPLRGRPWL